MIKKVLFLLIVFCSAHLVVSQDLGTNNTIKGKILNYATDKPLENVHIVNLNQVKGTITNEEGEFSIMARVNDTLYFSYLGFKSLRVRVSNDWLKFGDIKIKMTELAIALEDVVVRSIQLTGYLEVDSKIIPIHNNTRYSISGLNSGYEVGNTKPGAVSRVFSAIFNPADFLYNTFGKKGKQLRKLRRMKAEDEIRNLLQSKFDRETLMAVLQMERIDIDEILNNCNYSKSFISSANDLQILDAISECYEEFKVLNRKKRKG